MNIEVFVHGVPNGESFWGKDEDRDYFGNFYNQNSSDEIKFLIQTRSVRGKAFCYYHYLIYKNVIANEGRTGSYFGLSIRFDAYCKDFMAIYKVLDVAFTTYVLDKVLKRQENGSYKYLISDFAREQNLMRCIYDTVIKLVTDVFTGRDNSFCQLNNFANGVASNANFIANVYETTQNAVESTVRKHGRISMSPYYQTQRERNLAQQYESQLKTLKEQYEEKLRTCSSTQEQNLQKLRSDNKIKDGALSEKDRIIEKNKATIEKLENQIRLISNPKTLLDVLEQIRTRIIELADNFGDVKSNPATPTAGGPKSRLKYNFSFKGFLPYLNLLLLLIIAVTLMGNSNNNEKEISKLNSKFEEFLENQKALQEQVTATINLLTGTDSQSATASTFFIDVEGYNEETAPLEKGKSYNVKVKGATTLGDWEIEGCLVSENHSTNKITITPVEDKVHISYENDKGQKKERDLKVK